MHWQDWLREQVASASSSTLGDGSEPGSGHTRNLGTKAILSSTGGFSQAIADNDNDKAMGNVLAAALTHQPYQPNVYRAVGMSQAS